MSREHDRNRDDNQNQTDLLVFGTVFEARAVKAPTSSGKWGEEQQLICL